MQAVVNKLLATYELVGSGPLVLLLHGWGDTSQSFDTLQKHLAKQYQVLAVDLPGFGGTQPPAEVWNLDNYARFVEALLMKLKLDQPYAIIGHSNGGALAVRAVSMEAVKPKKLILVAASGIRTGGGLKRLTLKVIAKAGNIATLWMPERYRRALRQSLYGAAGSDMLVVPQLQATFKRTVRQDVQADAATVTVPTLLVYASNDRAVPLADGRRYHQLIKGSKLEVIAGAGHFVHHDQPEQVEKLIRDFLQ